MSKTVYLIGGVDSFGVPYTRDNKNHINHLSVVFDFLIAHGFESTMIDMYSMHKYNDTDYIDELLTQHISLHQIKEHQIESIDLCRKSGIFQFLQLPRKTKQLYRFNEDDQQQILVDIIKENKIMFIYSCGVNDFLKHMDTNLSKLLDPRNMETAFQNIEATIAFVMHKIEKNINRLMELNKEIEIYMMGVYIPTKVNYIRKYVRQPIFLYNKYLQTLCQKYANVHFIDNSNLEKTNMAHVDWHPNYMGQQIMGENIIDAIKQKSKILKHQ